ncbi:MAG: GTPase HflX, partial [Desulfobacterales bacterium]|nr:GTPase HflX [Desulfobacterales bacterium]
MKKPYGNTGGLKASQMRGLENLHRRRVPPHFLITPELIRDVCLLSHEISRQIGLLIDRSGKIISVIVGDHQKIVIPETRDHRVTTGRLRGVRCVHTHLKDEPLSRDDLTDLALLRLDFMAAVALEPDGRPGKVYAGHILPGSGDGPPYELLPPLSHHALDIGCLELIRSLEAELAHARALARTHPGVERALLVSVSGAPRAEAEESLAELVDLAVSGGVDVVETILQQRGRPDPRFLMGRGKLEELTIMALQKGASMIIFDQELNASQIRSIADVVELKVIDRTQLILDIFAQRAQTREGKLQVELAQMKYLLPRLVTKNTAMSRLTGGIGGRGPGETKLEINRRRVRERINRLSRSLNKVKKRRKQQRARRQKRELPVISIIGYTNAGKSTLLNTLTKSRVRAENRLFATLDPSSRRL